MNFEKIKKALEENKELAEKVATYASQTEKGKTILENYSKSKVEEAVKENTAKIYTEIDNDLFEALGERKQREQKTYDFIKEKAKQLKELKDKAGDIDKDETVKSLKAKIKELENSGSHNEHWKKTHEETVAKFQKEKAELEAQIAEKEKEYLTAQIEAELNAGLGALKFNENIPQAAIDAVIQVEKQKILEGAKRIDGKIVFHGEDGKPLLNKEFSPISSKELWEQRLEGMTAAGDDNNNNNNTPKGGGGAKPTFTGEVIKTGEGDNAKISLKLDKAGFSTRREFNELADKVLREQGIAVGTKEYYAAKDAAYKEYEVSKLKVQ